MKIVPLGSSGLTENPVKNGLFPVKPDLFHVFCSNRTCESGVTGIFSHASKFNSLGNYALPKMSLNEYPKMRVIVAGMSSLNQGTIKTRTFVMRN